MTEAAADEIVHVDDEVVEDDEDDDEHGDNEVGFAKLAMLFAVGFVAPDVLAAPVCPDPIDCGLFS